MTSRAHLLAGLRTGGPRSTSPFEGGNGTNEFDANAAREATRALLKANATPFMPNDQQARGHQQQYSTAQDLEARMAALQMQHSMLVNDASMAQQAGFDGRMQGQQPRRPLSQHQPSLSQQQQFLQQQQQAQAQAQQVDQLIRQKQAQLVQNQLLQHYQDQQDQLDALRQGQANNTHAQHLALQQQLLLAQLQSNQDQIDWHQRQAQPQPQQHSQPRHMRSASASQAAYANVQSNNRSRQTSQYMQQPQQYGYEDPNELSQQHQLLLQRINGLRQVSQTANGQESHAIPMRSVHNRSGSPGNTTTGQVRRERQPSSTAADTAKSWRSSSAALSNKARGTPPPPSIVVDDSASEKSDEQSSHDTSALETPETSEEDVGLTLRRGLMDSKDDATVTVPTIAPLPMRKRVPSTQQQHIASPQGSSGSLSTAPRVSSLGATPRQRNFASGEGQRAASTGSSSAGSITPSIGGSSAPQPSRQPRGPPTEFHSVNFAARLSLRTRREAMVKLSASPRIASISQPPPITTTSSSSAAATIGLRQPSV